jgi:hypothetical protein
VPVHEDAEFGLAAVRQGLPLAVGLIVVGVWLTLVTVMVRTVRGVAKDNPRWQGVPSIGKWKRGRPQETGVASDEIREGGASGDSSL